MRPVVGPPQYAPCSPQQVVTRTELSVRMLLYVTVKHGAKFPPLRQVFDLSNPKLVHGSPVSWAYFLSNFSLHASVLDLESGTGQTDRQTDRQTDTYLRGENCWMSAMATPLDNLSVKLIAPYTNAPHIYTLAYTPHKLQHVFFFGFLCVPGELGERMIFTRATLRVSAVFAVDRCPSVRHVGRLYLDG